MSSEKLSVLEEGQLLLFDKPLYWTSFDLVNKIRIMIRSRLGIKKIKVGHAGTLDPLATGLMIVCTGKATKRIDDFLHLDKEYIARLHFGETTPSYDLETEVNGKYPASHITTELIEETLKKFLGEQQQVPPLHSAKFIDGKRAYEFARKGIEMELKPVSINYRGIELMSFMNPDATIKVICSKGTYIRSFARDLGVALKSGCYLSGLERVSIGEYKLSDAYTLEKFDKFLEQLQQNGYLYV
jgi:tRNA pseudouridine 55 synthase